MAQDLYDKTVRRLKESAGNLRCSDVRDLLRGLGFDVRDAAGGGHKVFMHDHVEGFRGSNYDCGHGKDPELKKPYITSILRTLKTYESELRAYLKARNDD